MGGGFGTCVKKPGLKAAPSSVLLSSATLKLPPLTPTSWKSGVKCGGGASAEPLRSRRGLKPLPKELEIKIRSWTPAAFEVVLKKEGGKKTPEEVDAGFLNGGIGESEGGGAEAMIWGWFVLSSSLFSVMLLFFF